MLLTVLLQITEGITDTATRIAMSQSPVSAVNTPVMPPAEDTLTMLDLLMKGGYIMIPIGVLSLISIYVLIERYIFIRKHSAIPTSIIDSVKDHVRKGNLEGARTLCKSNPVAVSVILDKGISRVGKPIREIESAMESSGKLEIGKMEKNVSILGIVAGIAPMFGFIGTISGVIKIFYNISLADNISIGLISGGLYEKMITSAAGLVVGVFSFVSYHYLNIMIDKAILRMEGHSADFMDVLHESNP